MKRVKNHIVPIFSLIIYEICFFILVTYQKNLFDIRLFNSAYQYLPDFITKVILFLIYICIINLVCKYIFFNKGYLFLSEFFKNVLICFALILPVRFVFDIFYSITPPCKYTYGVQFIINLLFNIILFLVVFKKNKLKSEKINFNKKTTYLICLLFVISVLFIVISILKFTQHVEYINHINEKYTVISNQNELLNFSFEISLYTLLFNIISKVLIYFIFFSMVVHAAKGSVSKGKIVARIFSIIIAFILLLVIKAFLAPKNILHKVRVLKTETISYSNPKRFNANEKTLNIYRSNGYNNYDSLIFTKNIVHITYENKTINKFKKNLYSPEKLVEHGNDIFSYGTQAIMYKDKDKPICILSDEIVRQKENLKLTQVLEKLINCGYFEFLEYSYEYMLKHDKNYLKSFLKEYASGKYDEDKNYNINSEYIIDFSKNALENDFDIRTADKQ